MNLFGELTQRYWTELQKDAIRRGIPFCLTPKEAWKIALVQNKKCYYTDFPLEWASLGYRGIASLDRLESGRGYYVENCCWTISPINLMKYKFGENHFIKLCCLVAAKEEKVKRLSFSI